MTHLYTQIETDNDPPRWVPVPVTRITRCYVFVVFRGDTVRLSRKELEADGYSSPNSKWWSPTFFVQPKGAAKPVLVKGGDA